MNIVIEGLDEFKQGMMDASSQTHDILEKAMVQSINEIKNDAQSLAPFVTGTLRRSLFTMEDDNGMTGIVGADMTIAPYARAIEYGTIGMTINVPNGRRTKNGRTKPYTFIGAIQPHLYLTQAFEKNVETVKQFFSDAVLEILKIGAGQ